MKKQKRFKKIKLPPFLEDLKETVFNKLVAASVVLIFLGVTLTLTAAFLYRSDYFRLREIETKEAFADQKVILSANAELLRLYGKKNIFTLNLKAIERYLKNLYPGAKEIIVKVALPDKLVIGLKFRKAVALVSNAKQYPVDEDGMVLPNTDVRDLRQLPVISGVDLKDIGRREKKTISRNLALAIELLKAMKRAKFLAEYGVASIQAKDAKQMSFYLRSGVEIKIGCEDYARRLEALRVTLKDPRLVMDRIKYIDVRFKEVAIGPK